MLRDGERVYDPVSKAIVEVNTSPFMVLEKFASFLHPIYTFGYVEKLMEMYEWCVKSEMDVFFFHLDVKHHEMFFKGIMWRCKMIQEDWERIAALFEQFFRKLRSNIAMSKENSAEYVLVHPNIHILPSFVSNLDASLDYPLGSSSPGIVSYEPRVQHSFSRDTKRSYLTRYYNILVLEGHTQAIDVDPSVGKNDLRLLFADFLLAASDENVENFWNANIEKVSLTHVVTEYATQVGYLKKVEKIVQVLRMQPRTLEFVEYCVNQLVHIKDSKEASKERVMEPIPSVLFPLDDRGDVLYKQMMEKLGYRQVGKEALFRVPKEEYAMYQSSFETFKKQVGLHIPNLESHISKLEMEKNEKRKWVYQHISKHMDIKEQVWIDCLRRLWDADIIDVVHFGLCIVPGDNGHLLRLGRCRNRVECFQKAIEMVQGDIYLLDDQRLFNVLLKSIVNRMTEVLDPEFLGKIPEFYFFDSVDARVYLKYTNQYQEKHSKFQSMLQMMQIKQILEERQRLIDVMYQRYG